MKEIKAQGLAKGQEATQIRHKLLEFTAGKWDVTQDILIDVVVAGNLNIMLGKQKNPYSCPELLKLAAEEVQVRFGNEPELAEIITQAMPGIKALHRWVKRQDWKDEVEKRLKDDNLFSLDKRAAVINMIFHRALGDSDLKAAETYLKLSGDLTNKPAQVDKGYETYVELSESLMRKAKGK